MIGRVIGAVTLVGALALPASASAGMVSGQDASARALNGALDRIAAAKNGPPGLAVVIRRGSHQEFRSRGFSDLKTRRRPRLSDHYRIASMAKAFSGAVALRLVSQGKLSLDDTIGERLPGLMPLASDVTLAQALQHTGGLPDYIKSQAFIDRFVANPRAYLAPRELIGFVKDTPLRFKPGTRYEYSDTDNVIVGLMAEAVTGRSYERLLSDLVYRPLGLRQTSLPRVVRMPRPFMHGYEVVAGKAPEDVSEVINPSGAWASGGIVSNPLDVGSFFRAYVGGRLFKSSVRARQLRFRPGSSSPPGPGTNSAGMGVFRYRTSCGTVYGHTGSFPGYRLFAASSLDGRRSVVFTVNAQIVPREGQPEPAVSKLIRQAQQAAVCRALAR